MRMGNFTLFRQLRSWSNRRWSNTPKWLIGVDVWLMDSVGWGTLDCGLIINPRVLTVGLSWEIISANWIGTHNELLIRIHPLPMLVLYVQYSIPERWVKREIGTSIEVAGYFRH
jgi:hypothetical protein